MGNIDDHSLDGLKVRKSLIVVFLQIICLYCWKICICIDLLCLYYVKYQALFSKASSLLTQALKEHITPSHWVGSILSAK